MDNRKKEHFSYTIIRDYKNNSRDYKENAPFAERSKTYLCFCRNNLFWSMSHAL